MMLKFLSVFFITITALNTIIAQDIDFNQWQANYMGLNPAMTGISNNPRLNFAYRAVENGFARPEEKNPYARSVMVSYDQCISPKAGYIGVSYLDDVIDGSRIGTKAFRINYARDYTIDIVAKAGRKRFESDGNLHLRFGISIEGFQHSIIGASLQKFDVYNPRTGTIYKGDRSLPSGTIYLGWRPNFGIGTALNYKNIYAGFAIHNIIEPMDAFTANPTTRLPRRYSANIGVFLPFNPDNEKTGFMAPQFVFQRQNNISVFQPGINVNKGIVTAGASFRYKEEHLSRINSTNKTRSLNFLFGVSKGKFKAAYSYDFMLNHVFLSPHELSLTVYLGKVREGSDKGIAYYFRKMGF